MTGLFPFHWITLSAVLAIQTFLLWKARSLARQDDSSALARLQQSFAADVHARARRGHSPDWLRYQAEVDRIFEFRDDRLRSLAAAALAFGLGGTLMALFVSILFGKNTSFEPAALVQNMGVSLSGSLTGVIVNLVIILVYLPAAEAIFSAKSLSLYQSIEEVSAQNPLQESFVQTLREELSLIRQSLNTEFASAFSTAITGFPQVVIELGSHIEKLALVVTAQGRSIGGAVGELTKCATAVADSGNRLQPATEKLAEATKVLVQMPEELQEVVDETRNSWLTAMREQHAQHVQQLIELQQQVENTGRERERQVLEATRELQAAVAEVRDAVSRIPDHLASEVARVSGRLGIEFGREARDYTNELAAQLQREYGQLLHHIDSQQQASLNNIGVIVQELLNRVAGLVEERIAGTLHLVSQDLDDVVRLLPEAAKRFTEAHSELTNSQAKSIDAWREVSVKTGEAAQKLLDANGHLNVAVESLGASASHLEKVAQVTDGFQKSILASHRDAIEGYMENLDSLREQLLGLLQKVQQGQTQSDAILERQSEFIRACIEQLLKGRQLATLQAQRQS